MTVSIANMSQVWMSNTNTYNGIAMSISTLGYGANNRSRVFKLTVDGNTKFDIDGNGSVFVANSVTANSVISNTITSNTITSNTVTSNTLSVSNVTVTYNVTAQVINANVYATFLATSNSSFANLPNANTSGAGARAFVYDATATTFASAVVGGGTNRVPVYSNGRNWLIG